MRIARLDLLRYGKFTDQTVSMPRAARDFHLIVGPNEAGKSTLRSAILDLLFGIETRSRYNFLHPHNEMRLGALIEQDGKALDFVRLKARAKTLQDRSGVILPDTVLAAFMGTMERGFFDQMFGLDHDRLVAGGRAILNASNDVGQILFQSAAGIGSLGVVRDALEAEADTLWAKRRSGDREYYRASDELATAEAALKEATVRTKEWTAARSLVDQLEQSLSEARSKYRQLEQERVRLDRIRRVAPLITSLMDLERELDALGQVVSLPKDASTQLAQAELALAKADQERKVYEGQIEALRTRMAGIQPDGVALAHKVDIQAAFEQRQLLRNHPGDIVKRQEEVKAHWKTVEALAQQLGWPREEEEGLESRVPSQLVRSAIGTLIRKHDIVSQALTAAEKDRDGKQSEREAIDADLAALPTGEIPVPLKDALSLARVLGETGVQDRRLTSQVTRTQREFETAKLQLGSLFSDIDTLVRLQLPSQEEVAMLLNRRTDLEAAAASLTERMTETRSNLNDLQLEISQFEAEHHPVSLEELLRVRGQRNEIWLQIRTGAVGVTTAAPGYEIQVAAADGLSDQRHDKAHEASELQAKLDQKARFALQLDDLKARQVKNCTALAEFDTDWDTRMAAIGLAGMPLLQVNAWRASRERVLVAAGACADAQQALSEFNKEVSHATTVLAEELHDLVEHACALSLAPLVAHATELIEVATQAQAQRKALLEQQARARRSLADSEKTLSRAREGVSSWGGDWQSKLVQAHLPVNSDTGTVQGALTLFERIDDSLRQMRELRTNRIEAMQRDLDGFQVMVGALVTTVAPELLDQPADEVAGLMAQRLGRAVEADKELKRLQVELDDAQGRLAQAKTAIDLTSTGLAPMLLQVSATSNDALRDAIGRSDLARSLSDNIRVAQQSLQQASDGLQRDALQAEFSASDLLLVPGEQAATKSELEQVVERQNTIAAELNSARAALDKIAGQDAAARAESHRQEALARMANATERYIKVHTAARLLRWAIERYRESKQGPMLSRAGEIFSGLTLSTFKRLSVDYETEPLALFGQRENGEHVSVEGMSDGTRDQLFLALRLAAIEMHLEQAASMPFIADDLVINYDDGRAKAGLQAFARLSEKTQVIFLSHHEHLVPVAESVFGPKLNVVRMA